MSIFNKIKEWIIIRIINSLLKRKKMGELLKTALIKLLDKLKANSLWAYVTIAGLITGLHALAQSPEFTTFLIYHCEECAAWLPKAVQWLTYAVGLFTGVHTTTKLMAIDHEPTIKRVARVRRKN